MGKVIKGGSRFVNIAGLTALQVWQTTPKEFLNPDIAIHESLSNLSDCSTPRRQNSSISLHPFTLEIDRACVTCTFR